VALSAFLTEDDLVIRESIGAMLFEVLKANVVGIAETSDASPTWLAMHDGDWDFEVIELMHNPFKTGTAWLVNS
jgi:hypothetical protein